MQQGMRRPEMRPGADSIIGKFGGGVLLLRGGRGGLRRADERALVVHQSHITTINKDVSDSFFFNVGESICTAFLIKIVHEYGLWGNGARGWCLGLFLIKNHASICSFGGFAAVFCGILKAAL